MKMGYSVVMPGETVDVSAKHLTAPLIMRVERAGVKYDCIVIGGKCFDLVERAKEAPEGDPFMEKILPPEPVVEPEPIVEEDPPVEETPADEPESEVEEEPEVLDIFGEEKDLDDMNKDELIEKAKELGVSYSGLNKAPLLEAIKEELAE